MGKHAVYRVKYFNVAEKIWTYRMGSILIDFENVPF
jgi:hypothetical protein